MCALQIGNTFDGLGYTEFDDLAGDDMGDVGVDDIVQALQDVGALRQDVGALSIGDLGGRGRRGRGRGKRTPPGKGINARRLMPKVPGAPMIGVKLQPLGFNTVFFTATSGTALPASTRPQKPFKGKRLVVEAARIGVTAGGLVSITSVTVGVNNQFVSTGSVSIGAFANNSVDVNLELSATTAALDITVNYQITPGPTGTDTVTIGTTLIGETVGS